MITLSEYNNLQRGDVVVLSSRLGVLQLERYYRTGERVVITRAPEESIIKCARAKSFGKLEIPLAIARVDYKVCSDWWEIWGGK